MGRHKKTMEGKCPFKLRGRKLNDGRVSLFIDHISERRHHYESLKLYLLPETSENNRRLNRATLVKARETIESKWRKLIAQRIDNLNSEIKEISLSGFIESLIDRYRADGKKGHRHLATAKTNLGKFFGDINISSIGKEECRLYIDWLRKDCLTSKGKQLSPATTRIYFCKFNLILNHAARQRLISSNPLNSLERHERIKEPETLRPFLTTTEVKRLISTPYIKETVRNAFLFSCFSGLRISDIRKLSHDHLFYREGIIYLDISMEKTSRELMVPLSKSAVKYLPLKENNNGSMFKGLPGASQLAEHLRRWFHEAGVSKRAMFHCARHTFGTLLVTAGADIYTVSKLMGHSNVKTTQIYARIIDSKKIEAIDKLDKYTEA